MENIVKKLKSKNKTISIMESCTGGGLSNEITNIEGSSDVFNFSAVTYSNIFKIKMGVSKDIIDKYGVYSIETAKDMSKSIVMFTGSDYGIGITGELDILFNKNSIVYISIYDKNNNKYECFNYRVKDKNRELNKKNLIKEIINKLMSLI